MTALALAAFLGAALPAPAAFGAESEWLAAEAARQVSAFESLADLAVSTEGTGGLVGLEEASSYCRSSPMTIASLPEGELEILQACAAFVNRDPSRCRALPAAFVSRNSIFNCLGAFQDLSVFFSISAAGSASFGACEAGFGLAEPAVPAQERGKACAALTGPGDENSRCAALREQAPVAFRGRDEKVCGRYLSYLMRGEGCEEFRKGSVQESALCPAFAAYRLAHSAGDSGVCGSDYLCRALRGDLLACDHRRQARISAVCDRVRRTRAGGIAAATISPAMSRAIVDTLALSVGSIIDSGEREALERLHAMMLRERPFDPAAAVAGMARLRAGILEDTLSRAEAPASNDEGGAGTLAKGALASARARFEMARGRIAPPRGRANIRWVEIPGGNFLMGSTDPDLKGAVPRHLVTVESFQMAKTPVTNQQYNACVADGACMAAHVSDGTCTVYIGGDWIKGNLPESFLGDDQPVMCVDWEQAKAFAEWMGGRLPSEAEWEYAARSGGKDWRYPWGNEEATCERTVMKDSGPGCRIGATCDQGDLDIKALGCGKNATWPVCSKPKGDSEQGLCDMAGNVWQWTQDFYHDSYNGAPIDGSAWETPPGPGRVDRGGSWTGGPERLRSAWRNGGDPGARRGNLGFRIAR